MKSVFFILVLLMSTFTFAKQTIICSNPELKVIFDEKNLLDLKKSSYTEPQFSLKGKITQVIATIERITFIKSENVSSQLVIPREVHGKSLPYFQGIYSNATSYSVTPDRIVECNSSVR